MIRLALVERSMPIIRRLCYVACWGLHQRLFYLAQAMKGPFIITARGMGPSRRHREKEAG